MSNNNPKNLTEWAALEKKSAALEEQSIAGFFEKDQNRFENFSVSLDGLLLDFSKTKTDKEALGQLIDLAKACDLESWREKMFSGAPINNTEDRAVLHTALRGSADVDDESIDDFVVHLKDQMRALSDSIRSEKKYSDIVHIGIGGSDLGPRMICEALRPFNDGPRVHFVSNVDGADLLQVLDEITPDKSLFIISSKTFTTLETLTNARTAKDWLSNRIGAKCVGGQFMAVSDNVEAAVEFGIDPSHILPMRDWIGGRYSLWSGIGLTIAIACGYERFEQLLAGAHAMDEHFKAAPLEQNLPVLLGMLGIWHRNFCGLPALAILPYAHDLRLLSPYLQQLDMESNGKSVTRDGTRVDYETGPLIFGGVGTDMQHAFFQSLHQGTSIIPCEFIMIANAEHTMDEHHKHLLANAVAQSEAFAIGDMSADEPYRTFEGNRPNISIVLDRLDPYHLGMLLALYEHKIFVQGVVWNINSFDQWGVELGKTLARSAAEILESGRDSGTPSPSQGLLNHLLQRKIKNS